MGKQSIQYFHIMELKPYYDDLHEPISCIKKVPKSSKNLKSIQLVNTNAFFVPQNLFKRAMPR
jgi:hypothetical protein